MIQDKNYKLTWRKNEEDGNCWRYTLQYEYNSEDFGLIWASEITYHIEFIRWLNNEYNLGIDFSNVPTND